MLNCIVILCCAVLYVCCAVCGAVRCGVVLYTPEYGQVRRLVHDILLFVHKSGVKGDIVHQDRQVSVLL